MHVSCTVIFSANPALSDQQTYDAESNITCAEGFYLSNNSTSVCRPICRSWVELTEDDPFKGFVIPIIIIGLLSSVFVTTIGFIIQRTEMCVCFA